MPEQLFNKEPVVNVRIADAKSVGMEHKCNGDTLVKNVPYGIDFHWQSKRNFLLKGDVHIKLSSDNKCEDVINTLPVELYLKSVVSSEMNPNSPLEFLKAHAIISRSWLLGKLLKLHPNGGQGKEIYAGRYIDYMDTESHKGFDVCCDDHCQRYQGFDVLTDSAVNAVEATRGLTLVDEDGCPIDARFSKCCGGRTELFSTCWQPKDFPYLSSVKDAYCNLSKYVGSRKRQLLSVIMKDYDSSTNFYNWTEIVPSSLIRRNVNSLLQNTPELAELSGFCDIGDIMHLEPLKRGKSGRIYELKIVGTYGSLIIGKELIVRRILSQSHLRSSAFDVIRSDDNNFILNGKGWGHGVGLCQIGAAVMAFEGATYIEILSHYYTGAKIAQLYE